MTAAPAKLTNFQIESFLTQLPGWTVVAGKLHREYRFPNFGKAFGFMKTAAPAIEKMDHHPEWFNAYDRVVIDLTTHDAEAFHRRMLIWLSGSKRSPASSYEIRRSGNRRPLWLIGARQTRPRFGVALVIQNAPKPDRIATPRTIRNPATPRCTASTGGSLAPSR